VAELPFSIGLIQFLADHRSEVLTRVFQFFTFVGEVEGYVLLLALVYVAYDKRLAFRLAVLTLLAMSLNHLLKTLIGNPRPFVSQGSHAEKWAVSPEKAADLVTEFSTPSGHAMAGAAFYSCLYSSSRNRYVRIACIVLLLLTGLSRPYLGVHYLEDVLLGWVLGLSMVLLSLRYAEQIGALWNRRSHAQQVAGVVAGSALLWLATRALGAWHPEGQPTAFVGYLGFLTGIVIAHPLELKRLDFDPRSSSALRKALRYALTVGLVLGTLALLDEAFDALGPGSPVWQDLLRFLRYASAGVVAMLLGPLLFLKLGWAERAARGRG
jgi:membrane-associated phospholipid phosphatase